jgi:ATP-dependent Clp protease adaptor protein ClpS
MAHCIIIVICLFKSPQNILSILGGNGFVRGAGAHIENTLMQYNEKHKAVLMDGEPDKDGGGAGTDVVAQTRTRVKKPSMYKVLLLNDDYTPMDFVILVLQKFFHKNHHDAVEIMMQVHRKGTGVCGVYTYEVAETKVALVMQFSLQHEHPLQCTMERD